MERVATGVRGLDEILDGGLPKGSVTLVSGPSGAGKSLLSMAFLAHGAGRRERGLCVTVEEPAQSLLAGAEGVGVDAGQLVKSGMLQMADLTPARLATDGKRDGESRLTDFPTVAGLISKEHARKPVSRLVVDSLSAIGIYYSDESQFRQDLFRFCQQVRHIGSTALLIGESVEGGPFTRYGVEEFLCDGFVFLDLEKVEGELRRTLTVRKMRFTRHDSATHPMLVLKSGIRVSQREKVY